MSVISVISVSKAFGEKQVMKNFSDEIDLSRINVLMGESGCGKTTLLRLIAGLEKPDSGKIIGIPEKLSFMFQEDRLLPWLTASENISIVSGKERAEKYLEKVFLSREANTLSKDLSGGMKRRVALARAFAYESGLVILDEPFKGLDFELKEKMLELVKNEGEKRAVIVVTHEKSEAEKLGGKVTLLSGIPLKKEN